MAEDSKLVSNELDNSSTRKRVSSKSTDICSSSTSEGQRRKHGNDVDKRDGNNRSKIAGPHGPHRDPVPFNAMKKLYSTYTTEFRVIKLYRGRLYGLNNAMATTFVGSDLEGVRFECQLTDTETCKWEKDLVEGGTYSARKVIISDLGKTPRLLGDELTLQFTDRTKLSKAEGSHLPIVQPYVFSKLDEYLTLLRKPLVLRDVLVYIVDVKHNMSRTPRTGPIRKLVELYVVDETTYPDAVSIAVWDDTFSKLEDVFTAGMTKQFPVCLTGLKVKMFGDRYAFQTTQFSGFDMDVEKFEETKELAKALITRATIPGILTKRRSDGVYSCDDKDKISTIEQVRSICRDAKEKGRSMTDKSMFQPLQFWLRANIVYIYTEGPITYRGCGWCLTKAPYNNSAGGPCTTQDCGNVTGVITDCYKINFSIEDETGVAKIILFEDRAVEILRMSGADAEKIKKQKDGIRRLQSAFSHAIGRTMKFRIRFATYDSLGFVDRAFTAQTTQWVPKLFQIVEEEVSASTGKGKEIMEYEHNSPSYSSSDYDSDDSFNNDGVAGSSGVE